MAIHGMAKSAEIASPPETTTTTNTAEQSRPVPAFLGIADSVWGYFGVSDYCDRQDSSMQNKMRTIVNYAAQSCDATGDVLYEISKIEKKLGHPRMGVDRHDQVYQWISIQNQIKALNNRAKAYEGDK